MSIDSGPPRPERQIRVQAWDLAVCRENNSRTLLEFGAGKSLAQNIFLSYKFNQNIYLFSSIFFNASAVKYLLLPESFVP